MRHYVDEQRWREVDQRMEHQVENARQWRDVCLKYFGGFAEKK
jgi:alpha-glucuronidase